MLMFLYSIFDKVAQEGGPVFESKMILQPPGRFVCPCLELKSKRVFSVMYWHGFT